jgi:hypothetical protein
MKKYLNLLENVCKMNEAEWEWYATLFDRIQINEGRPQKYGTQYEIDKNDPSLYKLSPLENANKVDEYRKELGLPPIETWELRIKKSKN